STLIWLPLQTTGRNCRTCGGGQFGSALPVSANPPTSPWLLIPAAWLLLPPGAGSGVITPFCHTKPRQMRLVPKPQKSSPFGSDVEVSDEPGTWVALFRPAKDWLLGPPSVPRSVITPFSNTKE